MLAEMHCLELVCPMFLDGLPTVNRSSVVPHDNRVLRVERGHGGGVAVDQSIVQFLNEREKLLA